MVNKTFGQIMETGKLKLFKSLKPEFKDGEQKRDFIYVKDAVEMTIFFDAENERGAHRTEFSILAQVRLLHGFNLPAQYSKLLARNPLLNSSICLKT